jgi:hypothetical protein
MARNIQIPPGPGPSARGTRGTSPEGEKEKLAGVGGIPPRPAPLRSARRTGTDTRPGGVESDDETPEGSARISGRQGIPAPRIPRISFPRRRTSDRGGAVHGAESAEEMLLEYVSPPMHEPILETGAALRLLYALLSKVLPELKGNPNVLSPARAVMDDEKRRFSDLRARLNEQGLAA